MLYQPEPEYMYSLFVDVTRAWSPSVAVVGNVSADEYVP